MRIPFTARILLVLAGLACLVGPALVNRERANTAVRPISSDSGAVVLDGASVTAVQVR